MRAKLPVFFALMVTAGCSLDSDVVIRPLDSNAMRIDRGRDLLLRKEAIDSQPGKSAQELAELGEFEVAAGRYDDARRHLAEAAELRPYRTLFASIAWNLSQLEYMSNNFEASLEWASRAVENGISVKAWHLAYLKELAQIDVYRFSGAMSERLPVIIGHPDVPRVEVTIDGDRTVSAVIDSGAVLSIMSRSLAASLPVQMLGTVEGTYTGLLGKPIPVRFGIVHLLDLGGIRVANVPVAIMPDDEMKFLVTGKSEFKIDLLLGAHLLKEFRLEFDLRGPAVTLTYILPSARKPAADQNLFFERFRPAVHATINRHGWYLFVLDTGSEVSFLNERQIGTFPLQVLTTRMHNATLQGLGGSSTHGEKLERVEIGVDRWAGTYKAIPMYDAGEQESTAGILGENYLENFNVVIDFGRMRVDLKP